MAAAVEALRQYGKIGSVGYCYGGSCSWLVATRIALRSDWPGLELGWTFHPSHWGNGYATEAGRANMDWAFANHDVDELVSVILPENAASQAVARRLGFTLRDERVLSFFPAKPHGIWFKPRP